MTFDISLFNPGTQRESDFLKVFIARQDVLRYFLVQLRNTADNQAARHHLIVAPRGYGKTSLLRRLKIALRDEAEFNARFIPLAFREEQHNVISLDLFWRNCLQALLEAREDEQADAAELETLEVLWQQHAPRGNLKREAQDGEPAWTAFAEYCRKLGRRPVLLIDNLDALLAGLGEQQWGLRAVLQRSDGPVLIAAASRYPESLSDSAAAFFDFFRVTTLKPLSDNEIMACLREMAVMRGERGEPVRRMLDTDPGRIGALNTMAGGNPRTLGVLYTVLESHMSDDVLAQLSAMLDTFTGWYQARTEELPMQSRAVFDALALNWDPMQAVDLAKVTGLDTPAVSSHLSRMEKMGYVETVSLSHKRKSRNGYQVSERFFNIWYLMRNGPRRTRQAIQFLTIFLRSCFSRSELKDMAREKLANGAGRVESTLALAACIGDTRLRGRLLDTAESCLLQQERAEDLRSLVNELRTVKATKGKRATNGQGPVLKLLEMAANYIHDEKYDKAEATCREAIALDDKDVRTWLLLGGLLHHESDRYPEAESAYRQAIELDEKNALPWEELGNLFQYHLGRYDEAENAYRRALALDSKSAESWGGLGDLYQDHLKRYEEAEAAYRQAIALDDKWDAPWGRLGDLLRGHLGRAAEAEAAYRQAIALDETDANTWGSIGDLLLIDLERYEEAETAYRKALALDDKVPYGWRMLGHILQYHLGRYEEAESAYRRSIELNDKRADPWGALGDLLQHHLKRYEEAEAAYRQAIELDGKWAGPWFGLGHLLQYRLARYEEAEFAYRQGLALNDKRASAWGGLGDLLRRDSKRSDEAEAAYRQAISLDESDATPWTALGYLLREYPERYGEAEAAFRKGISIDGGRAGRFISLGNLLQDYLGRYEDAHTAYKEGLAVDPSDYVLLANSAYVCALHLGQHRAACDYAAQAETSMSQAGLHLLNAMLAWSGGGDDAAGKGWAGFHQAVSSEDSTLWTDYLDDLQRVLAYAIARGDGDAVVGWMETADYPQRYAPLYHAYKAALTDEDHLLAINPEVRGEAEKIHRGLARLVGLFRGATKPTKRKRS